MLRSVVLSGALGYMLHQSAATAVFNTFALKQHTNVVKAKGFLFPLCIALGFLASSVSRELGGSDLRRWAAALFPACVYLAGWFVMGLLVTPYQLLYGSLADSPASREAVIVQLLWVLLSDVLLPATGLARPWEHVFSEEPKNCVGSQLERLELFWCLKDNRPSNTGEHRYPWPD